MLGHKLRERRPLQELHRHLALLEQVRKCAQTARVQQAGVRELAGSTQQQTQQLHIRQVCEMDLGPQRQQHLLGGHVHQMHEELGQTGQKCGTAGEGETGLETGQSLRLALQRALEGHDKPHKIGDDHRDHDGMLGVG